MGDKPHRSWASGRRGLAGSVALVLAVLAPHLALAQAVPERPIERQAPGLEVKLAENVFVVPDPRATSITGWLIVKAGCADEAFGDCRGLAHYLEHLLFINRDNEQRSKVAIFGDGAGNGWTNHRTTVYYQRFPSRPETNEQNVDKLVGYLTQLLVDVRVEPAQADRERNIVLQEYQQNTGRNVFSRFAGLRNRLLLPNEPLGQPVIGAPDLIKAFSVEAARDFHAHWYAKNNAILVLHGPIAPDTIKPLITKHLDPLPVKAMQPHQWALQRRYEPETRTLQRTDPEAKQTAVYLDRIVTYQEPAADRRLARASRNVLGAFLSSRLKGSVFDVLTEQREVISQGSLGISMVRTGTMRVSFSGVPARGVTPDAVVAAARTYMAELAAQGIPQDTVDRLKTRIINQRGLLAQQPAQYAEALMSWLSSHDTHAEWMERDATLAAVSAESVKTVLQRIIQPGREVVAILEPSGAAAPSEAEAGISGPAPGDPAGKP